MAPSRTAKYWRASFHADSTASEPPETKKTRLRSPGASEAISAASSIARWPEADYVVATAGQFDLVVELVAADRRHLLELTSRLRALPDVVSTETFMYLEMWKQLYDWGSGMPKEETTR